MPLLFLYYKTGGKNALNLSTVFSILYTFIMSPFIHLLSKEKHLSFLT